MHRIHSFIPKSQPGALFPLLDRDTLRVDHTKLQQSSAAALDAAASHHELLERTIRRLRGELRSATKEREAMQKGREEVHDCMVILG